MITYKGYEMRSIAERRWARLFDVFGIHWVYEPKVYKTDIGGYLPDFYFPIADFFAEVKGPKPSREEVEKAQALERMTGKPVVFLYGRMEVLGGELFHGLMKWRHVSFATGEISEMLRDRGQLELSLQMAQCAYDFRPSTVPIGHALQEAMDEIKGREWLEKRKRETNQAVNGDRLSMHTVKTIGDSWLCKFHDAVSPIELR